MWVLGPSSVLSSFSFEFFRTFLTTQLKYISTLNCTFTVSNELNQMLTGCHGDTDSRTSSCHWARVSIASASAAWLHSAEPVITTTIHIVYSSILLGDVSTWISPKSTGHVSRLVLSCSFGAPLYRHIVNLFWEVSRQTIKNDRNVIERRTVCSTDDIDCYCDGDIIRAAATGLYLCCYMTWVVLMGGLYAVSFSASPYRLKLLQSFIMSLDRRSALRTIEAIDDDHTESARERQSSIYPHARARTEGPHTKTTTVTRQYS